MFSLLTLDEGGREAAELNVPVLMPEPVPPVYRTLITAGDVLNKLVVSKSFRRFYVFIKAILGRMG